jgi:excisionase family DNA binding protein
MDCKNTLDAKQDNGMESIAYTVEDVALLLKISYQTAKKLVRNGDIKSIKLGRQYRIPKQEIDRMMQLGG